jgi:hypothetical protein
MIEVMAPAGAVIEGEAEVIAPQAQSFASVLKRPPALDWYQREQLRFH